MIFIGIGTLGIDLGLLLLLVSLIAFIIDAIFVIFGEKYEDWETYSELGLIIGCSAVLVSFFYFGYSVITADYSFVYVSAHVSNSMDFFLRLSAIWSGQAGSYFFWTFFGVVLYLIFRTMFREYAHETFFWRSFVLLAAQIAIFITLTIMSDPFKINTFTIADGTGLNPTLMNIWNIIHPPMILLGYILCLIPMVIGFIRISILEDGKVPDFEGKEKLDSFFEFLVSLAWLFMSSGIIIGAYWAYITLGWGGFWAWDPVETASLMPWLFLTIFYHGKSNYHRKNEYLGNYIISMSYLSALAATYLTRSAIISSVHTFSPGGSLDQVLSTFIPADSFLMKLILRVIPDERMLFLFICMMIFLFLLHYLGFKKGQFRRISYFLTRSDFTTSKIRSTALKLSYIALFLGTYTMILGLLFPVIYDAIGLLLTAPILFEVYSFLYDLLLLFGIAFSKTILYPTTFSLIIYLGFFLYLLYYIGFEKDQIKRINNFLSSSEPTVTKYRRNVALLIGMYIVILSVLFPVIYDIFGHLLTDPIVVYFENAISRMLYSIEVYRPDGFVHDITIDIYFYNTILTLFGGIMLLAQFFCTFFPRFTVRRKTQLLIGGGIVGIVFMIGGIFYRNESLPSFLGSGNPIISFLTNFWTSSDKANLVLPLLLLGVFGLIYEFVNVTMTEEKHLLRKTSQTMLHLSILLILLGAITSANMTITTEIQEVRQGGEYPIPGSSLKIEITDIDRTYPESGHDAVRYDTVFLIKSGNRIVGYGLSRLAFDRANRPDQSVTLISDILLDIYIVTIAVYEDNVSGIFAASTLQIKLISYINILWVGCLFLHFAIVPLVIARYVIFKNLYSKKDSDKEKEQEIDSQLDEKINDGD
ncbi:hypothetical protein CEE45_11820 [Candidatus Heimdallarchaeota archaeon B3_Heim]|nr:MAG: hypothetical protein CEE45_11820 [Candidatus Heimdallarchaeota archaeon B3_Heim]